MSSGAEQQFNAPPGGKSKKRVAPRKPASETSNEGGRAPGSVSEIEEDRPEEN